MVASLGSTAEGLNLLQILKKTSTSAALGLLAAMGFDSMLAKRIRKKCHIAVLNLHRVSPDDNPYYPPIHPQVFERFLAEISKLLQIYSLQDLKAGGISEGGIVLSFDDGYRDFLEFAVPILSFFKIRTNQNIVPQCVLSKKPIWNVTLYDHLNAASLSVINELRVPGFSKRLNSSDKRSKLLFAASLSRFLKMRPRIEREPIWTHVEEWMLKVKPAKPTQVLSLEEILGLLGSHDFGAHSFAHESMEFESKEFFEQDLRKCQDYFTRELGIPLLVYAFPNGSYRPEQLSVLESMSFDFILLVEEKLATPSRRVLPRITFSPQNSAEARLFGTGLRNKGTL